MDTSSNAPERPPIIRMTPLTLAKLAGVGGLIGAVTTLLGLLLDRFIMSPLICGSEALSCELADTITLNVVSVVAIIAGLFMLVALRVYRPLLIVIGVTISLWGLFGLLLGFNGLAMVFVAGLLFLAAYGLFGLLASIRNFYVASALCLVIAVAARLLGAL